MVATSGADLVFFDPDNGVEVKSAPKGSAKAGKYFFWDELEEFWLRGQSLLVYHHLNRTAKAPVQIAELGATLRLRLSLTRPPMPLLFRRGSARVFWLVLTDDLAAVLERRVTRMLESGWDQHFEFVLPN